MGLFVGFPAVLCGACFLTEAIDSPLQVAMTVLAAAFVLGGFLITFLLWPRIRSAVAKDENGEEEAENRPEPLLTVYGEATQNNRIEARRMLDEGKDLRGPMQSGQVRARAGR